MSLTRAAECARCGGIGATFVLPTGPVCANCRRDLAYHPAVCPECFELAPIVYPSPSAYGVLVCAEEASIFVCTDCGREDPPYGGQRCARCVLADRLMTALTDPANGDVARLQPLFDAMISSERPHTAIYWFPPGVGPYRARPRPGRWPSSAAVPVRHPFPVQGRLVDPALTLPVQKAINLLRSRITEAWTAGRLAVEIVPVRACT